MLKLKRPKRRKTNRDALQKYLDSFKQQEPQGELQQGTLNTPDVKEPPLKSPVSKPQTEFKSFDELFPPKQNRNDTFEALLSPITEKSLSTSVAKPTALKEDTIPPIKKYGKDFAELNQALQESLKDFDVNDERQVDNVNQIVELYNKKMDQFNNDPQTMIAAQMMKKPLQMPLDPIPLPPEVVKYNTQRMKELFSEAEQKPLPKDKNVLMQGIEHWMEYPAEGLKRIYEGLRQSAGGVKSLFHNTGYNENDIARGFGNIANGVIKTWLNLLPGVQGLNLTMPTISKMSGNVAESIGLKREQGEELAHLVAPFAFGKFVGLGSLASRGVEKAMDDKQLLQTMALVNPVYKKAIDIYLNMNPGDQKLSKELLSNLTFFTIAGAGNRAEKNYLDYLDKSIDNTFDNIGFKYPSFDPITKKTYVLPENATRMQSKIFDAYANTKGRTPIEVEQITNKVGEFAPTFEELLNQQEPSTNIRSTQNAERLREMRKTGGKGSNKEAETKPLRTSLQGQTGQVARGRGKEKEKITSFERLLSPIEQQPAETPAEQSPAAGESVTEKPEISQETSFSDLQKPRWEALENVLDKGGLDASKSIRGFMFMNTMKASDDKLIYNFKHGLTRKYISVDKDGNLYGVREDPHGNKITVKLSDEEIPTELKRVYEDIDKIGDFTKPEGGTADVYTPYNEEYIAGRTKGLEKAGIKTLTFGTEDLPFETKAKMDLLKEETKQPPKTENRIKEVENEKAKLPGTEKPEKVTETPAQVEKTETKKKEAAEPVVEKQPYEMTKKEFVAEKTKGRKVNPYGKGGIEYAHKTFVRDALKEGKKVPEEVLKDYPDLQKKIVEKPIDLRLPKEGDSIVKAKEDIKRAKELMKKAPVAADALSRIKTKKDYQKYIDDTQEWIDKKIKKKPLKKKGKREPESLEEAVLSYLVSGGTVKPTKDFPRKSLLAMGINPFKISRKGMDPETIFETVSPVLWDAKYKGQTVSQSEMFEELLDKYDTHQSRVEALKELRGEKPVEPELTEEQQKKFDEYQAAKPKLDEIILNEYLDADGKMQLPEIIADANKIAERASVDNGDILKYISEKKEEELAGIDESVWDDPFGEFEKTEEITNEQREKIVKSENPQKLSKLAEDIEGKAESEKEADLNEAINKADEIISETTELKLPSNFKNLSYKEQEAVLKPYRDQVKKLRDEGRKKWNNLKVGDEIEYNKFGETNTIKVDKINKNRKGETSSISSKDLFYKITKEEYLPFGEMPKSIGEGFRAGTLGEIEHNYSIFTTSNDRKIYYDFANYVLGNELLSAKPEDIAEKYQNRIKRLQAEIDAEQGGIFPDENKIEKLNNEIKKLKQQQALEESQLGIEAEEVNGPKTKVPKGFDIEKSSLAELKNYKIQLESLGNKISDADKRILNKISNRIKAIESTGEQEELFDTQEELFSVKVEGKEKPIYDLTPDELKNLDFKHPSGGSSKSPKEIFKLIESEYETIYDLSQSEDTFRFYEALGKNTSWGFSKNLINKIKKNEPITVYRAVEGDTDIGGILPGAYVTDLKKYAEEHAENILRGEIRIEQMQVKPDELLTYDDPHEFIWAPKSPESAVKTLQQFKKEILKVKSNPKDSSGNEIKNAAHRALSNYLDNSTALTGRTTETVSNDELIFSDKVWYDKYGYDPVEHGFQKLKKGEKGYVEGENKYRAIFRSSFNPKRGHYKISERAEIADVAEEIVHDAEKTAYKKFPKLAKAIQSWKVDVKAAFTRKGQKIGERALTELFAKSLLNQYGLDAGGIDTFPVESNLYDAMLELMNRSKTGEKIFEKQFPARQPIPVKIGKPERGFTFKGGQLKLLSAAPPNAPPFFSKMQKVFDKKLPAKFHPGMVENIIKQGEIKQAEVEWSGIKDWLKEKQQAGEKISKQELLDFLKANELKIKEVVKGAKQIPVKWKKVGENKWEYIVPMGDRLNKWGEFSIIKNSEGLYQVVGATDKVKSGESEYIHSTAKTLNEAKQIAEQNDKSVNIERTDTKYGQYTLPGGENYSELLFTLPGKDTYMQRHKDWKDFREKME